MISGLQDGWNIRPIALTAADRAPRCVWLRTTRKSRINSTDIRVVVGRKHTRRAVAITAIVEHRSRAVAGSLIVAHIAVAGTVVVPATAVVTVIVATTATAVNTYNFVLHVLHFKASFERTQGEIH